MRTGLNLAALGLLAMAAACGQEEGRGGLTAEEERQLDNAAQMLDENMTDVSDVASDTLVANEAEIEAMEAEAAGNGADTVNANTIGNGQ